MPSLLSAIQAKALMLLYRTEKRLLAYALVKLLKEKNSDLILQELNNDLNNTEKKEGKIHRIFETSFDWKEYRTEKFIEQKLNYMHWNPCKGVNRLVDLPEQYIHSSATKKLLQIKEAFELLNSILN